MLFDLANFAISTTLSGDLGAKQEVVV